MVAAVAPAKSQAPPPFILGWRRVLLTLCLSVLVGLLGTIDNQSPAIIVIGRYVLVGVATMLAYGVFERWPARLPGWLPRWGLQLFSVFAAVPFAAYLAYWLTTGGDPDLAHNELRRAGYGILCFLGMFVAPWVALGALVRHLDAFARHQALAFELERSELERNALDARLRLLHAQVAPHFLFNTLANVQELVDAGSPQTSSVLKSLIAYLRAAVPRLHERTTTLGQELDLVRAYLEVMHMRMPDRLQFTLHIDAAARSLRCPPLTLLTLVENAVRHGIDPSEEGGRIDVEVRLRDGRCWVRVTDTGVGLKSTGNGLGTGLSTLRERLELAFANDANVQVSEIEPHGVRAELDFPAQPEPA
jgi:signal transduction histidine kinase